MFGKNDNQSNDRVIYEAKPNLILGCKKAILGFILLLVVLFVSGPIIQFIGEMQVYLISQIRLPLTRYTAVAVFVVMLIIILYIIWQIIGWYATEYILTDSKIIVKSGVVLTRKNYMPYATIQDINTSQSIFARLFNVGTISVYSAYDNNQIALENISTPTKVEEIIFSNMSRARPYYQEPRQSINTNYQQGYQQPPRNLNNNYPHSQDEYYQPPQQEYYSEEDYYDDDDVVITPIHQEEEYQRRQYDYYPEDLNYNNVQRPKYEYEPYDGNLENNINRAMNNEHQSSNDSQEYYPEDSYQNNVMPDYSQANNDYQENEPVRNDSKSREDNTESSERVIKRHFDKFKK